MRYKRPESRKCIRGIVVRRYRKVRYLGSPHNTRTHPLHMQFRGLLMNNFNVCHGFPLVSKVMEFESEKM